MEFLKVSDNIIYLDVDEGGTHGPHEVVLMWEGDAARADRVLQFIDVDTRVHHAAEQLVHDVREIARCHRAMQVAHEHRLLGI